MTEESKELTIHFSSDQPDKYRIVMLSLECDKLFEWKKWQKEIPYLSFPADYEAKPIYPFLAAFTRFLVRKKGG